MCLPRASFIQQPRGKNNLLPVLMVRPAAPVWIGFRGRQSQAIRSKWSLCNTRQTAKSFRTSQGRRAVCVAVYSMCVYITAILSLPYFTQPVTGFILVYFQASDLPYDPFILTSPNDCKPHHKNSHLFLFNDCWVSHSAAKTHFKSFYPLSKV